MSDISIKAMAHQMAAHAAARQAQIARNVANADTPGYRSTDIPDFADIVSPNVAMKATRPGHIGATTSVGTAKIVDRGGEASPNGNNVSLEIEMMRGAEAKQAHDMALSIYSSARDILTSALGKNR